MAIVFATKSGNWTDTTVWNTGALPTSADDVYSNTFTVSINTSPTVLRISNVATTGVTAGGSFTATNGAVLTCTGAGIVAGATTCLTSALTTGQSFTIISNVTGGTAASIFGVSNTSSGTLNVSGNCTGGTGTSSFGVQNASTGIVNITGNCTGSTIGTTIGANNNSTGILNITGNCTGGSGTAAHGAQNASTGTVNITGNCTGGTANTGAGANNSSTGTLNIIGNCTGGTAIGNAGAINASTGTMTVTGSVFASATAPGIGVGAAGQATVLTGPLISTDASFTGASGSGVNPCVALRWFPADTALTTFEYRMRGATVSGSPSARPARQFFLTNAYDAGYPAIGNVRNGITYGPGNIYTGTCNVPSASSVLFGVPVDATIGSATINAADIRNAVGLSSANLDSQLAAVSSGINPSNVASAVRTNLTPELSRLSNAASTQEVSDMIQGTSN